MAFFKLDEQFKKKGTESVKNLESAENEYIICNYLCWPRVSVLG